MPTQTQPGGHLLHNLMLFGRVLRGLGLDVHAGSMLDAVHAVELIGMRRKRDFREALRTVLAHRRQDVALFDDAFEVFWRAPKDEWTTMDLRSILEQRRYRKPQIGPPPTGSEGSSDPGHEGPHEAPDRVDLTRTYSAREVLRTKDFAEFSGEEVEQAKTALTELDWDLGIRRTRRWTSGHGRALDLRRAVRLNMAFGGELVLLPHKERKHKPRPLVLICDVSGSMERYTRMLLHFIHALSGDLRRVESFLFATRLTRITPYLAHRSIDQAVTEVSQAVPDWAGGTRIGDILKAFNFQWARRVLGGGSVVLVISDGWDRGEPGLLRAEIVRLQRSCHRLIWLNPLVGAPDYEPLTRGMQAAMPFVDDLMPVHNLASLEELARHLSSLSPRRPTRRQQTPVPSEEAVEQASPPKPTRQRSYHKDANPSFRHPMWGKGRGREERG